MKMKKKKAIAKTWINFTNKTLSERRKTNSFIPFVKSSKTGIGNL